ncbi:two-component sensor histidine kinase [Actinoplanes cyaneus]|uniref:histidine kinase n=1 Tax=Actinoplanes cyaneus TaxID=52696 RepID=A0A919M857_9ACTN|nr:two-component sensor histidine kinase [Actinoplanes cyaneus]
MSAVEIRGRLVEIALGTVMVVAVLLTAAAIATTWGGWYWLFGAAMGLCLSAIALARRRKPVVAATVGLVTAMAAVLVARLAGLPREPGPAGILALAVLVGMVVRRSSYSKAVAVVAGALTVVFLVFLASRPVGGEVNVVAALNALGWAGAIATGLALRLADRTKKETEERVRRDERLALARELHDMAAHHLTGLVVQAQSARILARKRPGELDESLQEIESAGSDALTAIRRVVGLLRDDDAELSAQSAPEQVRELVRLFERHGPPVRLDLPQETERWSPRVTGTVHRVVRESLTNIARHAPQASEVDVTVEQDDGSVHVRIANDGAATGLPARCGGYGLIGMRERVEALGGTFRAGPRDDTGWLVDARLPAADR